MIRLINASAHDTGLDAQSVHCIVTSPPYWGLRAYAGDQSVDWPAVDYSPMPGIPAITIPAMRCGLGEEDTPEAFIGHLILVMREMWRVLRDDGTCWVNLGDSYNGSGGAGGDYGPGGIKEGQPKYSGRNAGTLKPKDLCLIPARFALAAQADGWWVRSDIIWAKPNPMPESVTDRPTKAHEYIYLLAKSQRYFYDAEAVKEESVDPEGSAKWYESAFNVGEKETSGQGRPNGASNTPGMKTFTGKRNRRTVWNIATRPYSGAHFATWPPDLVRPMILAGTSARGVCPACGSPWERVVERTAGAYNEKEGVSQRLRNAGASNGGTEKVTLGVTHLVERATTGWRATCECLPAEPIPATVLDPFNGSGTSGTVALDLGRAYVGVDISEEYVTELAEERIGGTQIGFGL